MSVNTILLDFSVEPSNARTELQQSTLAANVENVLRDHLANLKLMQTLSVANSTLKVYANERRDLIYVRVYDHGLITINLEYLLGGDSQPQLLTFDQCNKLKKSIAARINIVTDSFAFMPIKRGNYGHYFNTSDDRLMEYDIDRIVVDTQSPFQKVQIVHSKTMGNMLVLDGLQNIAESDLIYTETLMARGKENYKDKEIVILGGGDGALLYELLKEQPAEVIMLEIDEIVMKSCAKHMRSICGDVLDNMSGPHYKIIVGDCMVSLDQYIKDGRKFDYIFADLTDVPISETASGELWDFINKVLTMSFKILKPTGKFMTHIIGSGSETALKMYETQLLKLEPPVTFTKSNAFVPSFLEDWVFCQVSFAKEQ